MDAIWERAFLLYREDRWQLSEKACREILASDPQHFGALWLLALNLLPQKRWEEATEAARQSILAEPENEFGYYVFAQTMFERNRLDEAGQALQHSLQIEPDQPGAWSMLALIRYQQERFQEAYDASQQGLKFDPDHGNCLNFAAMAANRLGRSGVAEQSLRDSLSRDPENELTHANLGWMYLQNGDAANAVASFRESLRIAPDSEAAKSGLLEAIKARNAVYRAVLRFNLWMARQSSQSQWVVAIGCLMGYRFIAKVGRFIPALAPLTTAFLTLYLVLVAITWLLAPLTNLLMRLHPDGKYALNRKQIVQANVVGGLVLVAIVGLAAYFAGDLECGRYLALTAAVLVPAAVGLIACQVRQAKLGMYAITAGLFAIGMALTTVYAIGDLAPQLMNENLEHVASVCGLLLPFAALGAQFAAGYFPSIEERR